jgi:hypothetical protein
MPRPPRPVEPSRATGGSPHPSTEHLDEVERELHRAVRAVGPTLRIERKWNNDWYAGTDLILCIGAFSHHVGVEFWRGADLVPKHPILQGTGKNLRHLKVRTLEEARSASVAAVIRAAVRLDRMKPKRTRQAARR